MASSKDVIVEADHQHVVFLTKLCRICGSIIVSNAYKVSKYCTNLDVTFGTKIYIQRIFAKSVITLLKIIKSSKVLQQYPHSIGKLTQQNVSHVILL